MSKPDKIEKDDAGSKSCHYRKPGRNAKQKHEFRELVQDLKRVTLAHRYTRSALATELGVLIPTIDQWWSGYTQLAVSAQSGPQLDFEPITIRRIGDD